MSISLQEAKQFLDVIHSADDDKIQMLLDGAMDEALQFMDRSTFSGLCQCDSESPSESEEEIPASVRVAVLMLLQANYQSSPQDAQELRKIAEIKLMPYRCNLGV
ncbi:head-tail connector protein [Microbulbifer thermotolerans]|uniref:head-tail connector protein n=1 Tax=Microbulbifer thermotolerans TaxID=252514 RepID=UPI002673423E|nr:head-tail connector protein [Microbulbifer thermotolerans]WKT59111.1 head-tail connector protein [Microbulbifer thermotolerans]